MPNLIRNKKYTIDEVLSAVEELYDKKWSRLINLNVYINTNAFALWKKHGVCCCIESCSKKGLFFASERTPGSGSMYNEWHLNLYGIDDDGDEVLMTQDHVLAKGNGGADTVDNLQPMCYPHNQKKGDKDMATFITNINAINNTIKNKLLLSSLKTILTEAGLIFKVDYLILKRKTAIAITNNGLPKWNTDLEEKIKKTGIQILPYIDKKNENEIKIS